MSISIRDLKVDREFREAIPYASSDERAELRASVVRFGYLSPIIAWKNERGEFLILDGFFFPRSRLKCLCESSTTRHDVSLLGPVITAGNCGERRT